MIGMIEMRLSSTLPHYKALPKYRWLWYVRQISASQNKNQTWTIDRFVRIACAIQNNTVKNSESDARINYNVFYCQHGGSSSWSLRSKRAVKMKKKRKKIKRKGDGLLVCGNSCHVDIEVQYTRCCYHNLRARYLGLSTIQQHLLDILE
jgi:hypothetical protein